MAIVMPLREYCLTVYELVRMAGNWRPVTLRQFDLAQPRLVLVSKLTVKPGHWIAAELFYFSASLCDSLLLFKSILKNLSQLIRP